MVSSGPEVAGGDRDDPVPHSIPGANAEEQRARYAEVLSAQVRLSFPTAVVAHMVKSGETPLAADPSRSGMPCIPFSPSNRGNSRSACSRSNSSHPEQSDNRTRSDPRGQAHPTSLSDHAVGHGHAGAAAEGTGFGLRRRALRPGEFVEAFKGDLGGEAQARLTYAKAQQVHFAILNIATSYLLASTAPGNWRGLPGTDS